MRIEELSVGDWVKWNGKPRKIEQIGYEGEMFVKVGVCHYCSIEECSPIPLTPEILEKNGFVKNGEYNEWNIGTWETPYLLGVSLERPAITIKWNGSSIFIDQAKYVHQLQHALRLAGIEKEIEV